MTTRIILRHHKNFSLLLRYSFINNKQWSSFTEWNMKLQQAAFHKSYELCCVGVQTDFHLVLLKLVVYSHKVRNVYPKMTQPTIFSFCLASYGRNSSSAEVIYWRQFIFGSWLWDCPDDVSSEDEWNIGQFLRDCRMQHLRRQSCLYSLPLEL
jgi:hypothetical protein